MTSQTSQDSNYLTICQVNTCSVRRIDESVSKKGNVHIVNADISNVGFLVQGHRHQFDRALKERGKYSLQEMNAKFIHNHCLRWISSRRCTLRVCKSVVGILIR